jgi:hypothetical protein
MPQVAVDRLEALLKGCEVYLEFGSGGSTVLAARLGVRQLISVESDADWCRELISHMDSFGSVEKYLLYADIGATGPWGNPVSDSDWKKWHKYPLIAWDLCMERNIVPTLILIDGRFRVASFLATLIYSPPGATVLFDDYIDRIHYHSIEQFVTPCGYHDRMAEFVTPSSINRDEVWRSLVASCIDVR